ncbi:MAG: tetratricopeptide repeat protein [Cyanobacteria bacterium SZAS LIN-2]|nr:tetratricopeptide repeat protein [Cyanobacteria bacterium SZAS LIN-2]
MSAADYEHQPDQSSQALLQAQIILPSISHRIYTLIGFAWPSFGFLFLILLCDSDWFALPFPIQWLFPAVCLLALAMGHLIAMGLESSVTTRALDYFRRGMPLIFYRRFAVLQEPPELRKNDEEAQVQGDKLTSSTPSEPVGRGEAAIVFGARRVLLSAVDELHLTFLGSLEIKSYAASGRVFTSADQSQSGPSNKPDLLVRFPLGALSLVNQKRLVEIFRSHRLGLTVNKRLDDRLKSPIVKGQAAIQAMGAVILLYALFDVSYATFTWLEMLRDYYGCQLCMRHSDKADAFLVGGDKAIKPRALELYDRAEDLRTHPAPLSWAYRALFANGNSAAQLLAIRAETLYWLDKRDQAIQVLEEAVALKPTGYKVQMHLARWLAEAGRLKEAQAVLDTVLEKHKDALLPRLYNQALVQGDTAAGEALYKRYLGELDEEVFGDEPGWPPGSEKPLMEMWRRDDLEFLKRYFVRQDPQAAPARQK